MPAGESVFLRQKRHLIHSIQADIRLNTSQGDNLFLPSGNFFITIKSEYCPAVTGLDITRQRAEIGFSL
jgi:hypothetical protein